MPFAFDEVYGRLRGELLARHFAFGKFWRTNLFTNAAALGDISEAAIPPNGTVRHKCFVAPCVPRRAARPLFDGDAAPARVPDLERWRVWVRDRSNPLFMTGLRAVHLCVDHRLGAPHARTIVKLLLKTTGSLFKWPEDSPFGGYVLRWDPATDDQWELRIDSKGRVEPMVPCRFLLNSDLKSFSTQRYLYCTPRDDPRYRHAVKDAAADPKRGIGVGQDRFRRWEPSKDEYLGLIAAYAMFFDTFSGDTSPDGQAIVEMVRSQCRRVAKYLQRFGYLVVRPCGGVTARGCGELFPLLEFPFGKVFERILGDPHRSADGAYEAALATAGLSPWAAVGSLAAYVGGPVSSALRGAFDGFKGPDGSHPEWAENAARGLDEDHKKKVLALWEDRDSVDAIGAESQNEPTAGFILASLPRGDREKVYHQWFTTVGAEGNSSEDFKPLIALMLMDDDRTRRLYQDWFNARFTRPSTLLPSPPHVSITNGARDTCFLTAIAMTIAHRRGDTGTRDRLAQFVEEDARTMAREIVEHSRETGTELPVNLVVQEGTACPPMDELENESCSTTATKKLAAELHDKRGGYFGLLPALALAWRHLLDGGPQIFSEITLPSTASVNAWPEPVVPRAVIAAVGTDRMPVPINALSLAVPSPDGAHDVPLYRDPPPKPADNDIGARPNPRGEMRSVDRRGGVFATVIEEAFPYPAIGVDPPESDEWSAAPAFAEVEKTLVESHEFEKRGDQLVTKVKLRAVQANFGWDGLVPRVTFTYARLRGTYSLSWVRQR